MKSHIAEYVSPGHPDRLADATVEAIVDLAVSRDAEALVGVECAVHTDHVFIDGRIAAGHGRCAVTHGEIEAIARDVYRAAGYGRRWIPASEDLKVIQNICLEPLSDDERAIRDLSDDQNVVSGYACDHPETDYLPPAHFVAGYIGRKVDAWRRALPEKFGPDFKVLVHLAEKGGGWEWRRLTLSIQHAEGVFQREQHELITPVIHEALAELEARGVRGIGRSRRRDSSSMGRATSFRAARRGTTAFRARNWPSTSTGRKSRLAAGRFAARTRTKSMSPAPSARASSRLNYLKREADGAL